MQMGVTGIPWTSRKKKSQTLKTAGKSQKNMSTICSLEKLMQLLCISCVTDLKIVYYYIQKPIWHKDSTRIMFGIWVVIRW